MEANIRSSKLHDAILSHDRCDMKIVHPVAGCAWVFNGEIADHLRVAVRFQQESKGRRQAKVFDEIPGCHETDGVEKRRPMGNDPQELVGDRPGDPPALGRSSPLDHQPTRPFVLRGFPAGSIYQQIRVDDEHAQPFFLPCRGAVRSASKTSYSASRFATSTKRRPTLKLGRLKGRFRLRLTLRPCRRHSVTRVDRVSPRSAARRFRSRKTGSGMMRVVFIWKTITGVRKDVN